MSRRYHIIITTEEECNTCGHKHSHEACLDIATGVNRVHGYTMCLHMYRDKHYRDIEAMREWTKSGKIEDEYHKPFTHEEFWKLVDSSLVDFIR